MAKKGLKIARSHARPPAGRVKHPGASKAPATAAAAARAPAPKPARPAVHAKPASKINGKPAATHKVNGKPAVAPHAAPVAAARPGDRKAKPSGDRRPAAAAPVAAATPVASAASRVEKAKVVVPSSKKLRREKLKEAPRPLVPLPPPPVTTDSKPKKNLAGLSVKELDAFRSLLLAKRRELLGDMSSMEREALQSGQGSNLSNLPVHMADMGTDNYEQEFTLGLVEKDRQLLREINHALAKIHDGSYGICEGTGKPINKQRLEIQPWARFSVEHARALEKNMMIRR